MRLPHFLALLGLLLPTVLCAGVAVPLHTQSRWIMDNNNKRFKMRCVNWAAHMETNLPEGLHKTSLEWVVYWIHQQGFNCVRLTYSVDHALNPSVKVSDSFRQAAGAAGVPVDQMMGLYNQAVAKNPFLATATTRDVFSRLVDLLWSVGIVTILDNHVSKASWCCDLTDGNGWWNKAFGYNAANSRFFDADSWLHGLEAMARWSLGKPGIVGMSLRNELRAFLLQDLNGRNDWYKWIGEAGRVVHGTNPDLLVIVGGVQSSTDLSHIRTRNLDTSAWKGKHVWEWHSYSFTVTFPHRLDNCDLTQQSYGLLNGFLLEQGKGYTGPLLLSEFGAGMTGGAQANAGGLSDLDFKYLTCLASYMRGNDADWAVWAIQGTYYVRNKQVDFDESWGLLNKDWTGWRNPNFKSVLGSMWQVTQGP